ncbi:hypothetical protein Q8A67_022819 [Cirrhinus molitorella]|uniref:Uncharacterized protein n=1 Tax=Cirrhinus molitorella TaxID=172907 RepID=A0AA88P9M4_9TELE|nr:hypothetical protein Q8A67_022819 [Cirrhinus molitorella]
MRSLFPVLSMEERGNAEQITRQAEDVAQQIIQQEGQSTGSVQEVTSRHSSKGPKDPKKVGQIVYLRKPWVASHPILGDRDSIDYSYRGTGGRRSHQVNRVDLRPCGQISNQVALRKKAEPNLEVDEASTGDVDKESLEEDIVLLECTCPNVDESLICTEAENEKGDSEVPPCEGEGVSRER